MKAHRWTWIPVAAAIAMAVAPAAQAQGYEHLPRKGAQVLWPCNPDDSQDVATCRVDGLPGAPGFTQVGTRQTDVVRNGVTIGSSSERVWRDSSDPMVYIFGVQVTLDDVGSDGSGRVFRTNDLFRRTQKLWSVAVAYDQDVAPYALHMTGRTAEGLNEYDEAVGPERDDSWVDFRVVVDPSSAGASVSSPWLLTRVRAPRGYTVDAFGIRLLDSDFEHPKRETADIFISSFEPVGVPAGGD